jgi:hypothetical protein
VVGFAIAVLEGIGRGARMLASAEAGRHGWSGAAWESGERHEVADALTSMPSLSANAKSEPRAEIVKRSGHGDRTHYIRHHHH